MTDKYKFITTFIFLFTFSAYFLIEESAFSGNDNMAGSENLYQKHCKTCHGRTLKGTPSAPSLVGTNFVKTSSAFDIRSVIENGRRGAEKKYSSKYKITMPSHRGKLSDEEIMSLTNLIMKKNGRQVNLGKGHHNKYGDSRTGGGSKFDPAKGSSLYLSRCKSCHGKTLRGTPMAPSLVENVFINTGNAVNIIDTIVYGRRGDKKKYSSQFKMAMPAHNGKLTAEQIATVTAYLLYKNGINIDNKLYDRLVGIAY